MNILSSIVRYRCPKCRKGKIFKEPFNVKDPLAMPDNCAVCGQKTMPEPGFYYGAMFLSYIVTGFLYLGIVAVCILVFDLSVNIAFLVLIAFVALTYFKTARIARSLWLHLMVKYEGKR
jgi:uncharacterized protein (DUF983 family)